jgi:hypothetical protein
MDERLKLHALAIVIASIHLLPAQEENKLFFASDLAKLVNEVHQPHSMKTYIDANYLSHALLQYNAVLQKRFGWKTYQGEDMQHLAEPIGKMPLKAISLQVVPKFTCPSRWTPHDTFDTRVQAAHKMLSKRKFNSTHLEDAGSLDPVAYYFHKRCQHRKRSYVQEIIRTICTQERAEAEAFTSSSNQQARFTA